MLVTHFINSKHLTTNLQPSVVYYRLIFALFSHKCCETAAVIHYTSDSALRPTMLLSRIFFSYLVGRRIYRLHIIVLYRRGSETFHVLR